MTTLELHLDKAAPATTLAGPRPRPVVGNLIEMRRGKLDYFVDLLRQYPTLARYYIGPTPVLMVNRPEFIKHILQDNHPNYRKSVYYEKIRPILGEGIFLSEGEVWLGQRRTLSPGFQREAMRAISVSIGEATNDMIARWRERADTGEVVDVSAEMMALTLDIVFRALLNVRLGVEARVVSDHFATVLREAERRIWSIVPLTEHVPTRRQREFRRSLAFLNELVDGVIAERQADPDKHEDLLSLLFAAHRDPSREEMQGRRFRDQIMSVILAGHETTANALSWVWYLLSRDPGAARKVKAEADAVLGERAAAFSDLGNLGYTRMVLDEALRLFPPVWTISRNALGPDRLGEVEIREGDTLMLCAYAVHRSPRHWDDPEGFDPERFAPERGKTITPYAYFPFGGGPRNCIGKRFGLIEGQMVAAMVARAFRLDLVPGHKVEAEPMVTLRPQGGLPMTIHARPG